MGKFEPDARMITIWIEAGYPGEYSKDYVKNLNLYVRSTPGEDSEVLFLDVMERTVEKLANLVVDDMALILGWKEDCLEEPIVSPGKEWLSDKRPRYDFDRRPGYDEREGQV